MKKVFFTLLSILILSASVNVVSAKVKATDPETAQAIKYYKAGNYVQSYISCLEITKKQPENALAHYYLAMSDVQLGKKAEAIAEYQTVMLLSQNGVLGSYAKKGKKCIETPHLCHETEASKDLETWEDKFIKSSAGFSKKARGVHEREEIENIKREINRNDEMAPSQFRGYKDYSSYAPSNDEIVAALRTLQRAGLSDVVANNGYNDMSRDMLNMLYDGKNSNLNPQVIQSLLTTQMSTSF